ncbi:MAG: sarcosine oxidase subunit gamma family protein [Halomonas meridiana]|uniref:sarcosine oxidase subunit gamma n=1 Tax=Halomonadaceae TaxID=28256 RepID=UPI0004817E3B|nr:MULTISPECIES: sarcosine oxidase subunit gamma family protein [Halomonas]MAO49555.1 sarcosine oxidase subunit gamma family protein [Pusillimonas sp.]MCE7521110.1 sarcosine oxidase subunit gamma family protein [Halomonas titanicae]MDK2751056.1 sarcosine oxidase subunit gamma family protein [Halomonas meridiana]|tara:strand:- start:921 stop:1556 length:636 start_codon:yes stop_codon:yes gene_type:complete
MSDVKEFDTRPAGNVEAESPLAWSLHRQKALPQDAQAGVTLQEQAFLGHLVLRGGAITLDEAVREVLGIALPAKPNTVTQDASGERSIQWMSPDEWLVIVPSGEEINLESQLRKAMGQAHCSIVNVSGGQTVLTLEGEKARDVLMKSTPYDVHPQAFPVGKGVTTVFAKSSIVLRRPTEHRWELVVRRSFADYCYRWLLDAAAEHGIDINR